MADDTTTVHIPASLRSLTAGLDRVEACGRTVREVLSDLDRLHPGLRDRVVDDRGVRRFMNVFVGDEDIRHMAGLDTEVKGAPVTIVPAIAGG